MHEDWASFGDGLRMLADKAYSDLEEKTCKRLALNQFLAQIENSQIAFGVKQRRPKNVEEAVAAIVELESYLSSAGRPVTNAFTQPQQSAGASQGDSASPVSTVKARSEPLLEVIRSLTRRLQQLEGQVSKKGGPSVQEQKKGRSMMVCWSCGERGHMARVCPNRATLQQQESSISSVVRACHVREGGALKAQGSTYMCEASYHVCGLLGSVPVVLVVDTGSAVSLLREDVWTRLCMNGTQYKLQQWTGKKLACVNGTLLSVKGVLHADVSIKGAKFKAAFVVCSGLLVEALVGWTLFILMVV